MDHFRRILIAILIVFVMWQIRCAKRNITPYDELTVPAEIALRLDNGEQVDVIAVEKSADKLQVQIPGDTAVTAVDRSQIAEIGVYSSEYDESGDLITRNEISAEKTNKNAYLYTIGGGALSFGMSLFVSSLVYRSMDDKEFHVLNPISIGGGILGTALMLWQGKKRDRMLAVERVKDQHKTIAEQDLQKKRKEQEELKAKIEKLQNEKAQIEAEKARLKELLKKKEKEKKKEEN